MVIKIDPKKESYPEILDNVLNLYKEGAPCHSSLFHKHKIFNALPKETQVEKCVIKCKGKDKESFDFICEFAKWKSLGKQYLIFSQNKLQWISMMCLKL